MFARAKEKIWDACGIVIYFVYLSLFNLSRMGTTHFNVLLVIRYPSNANDRQVCSHNIRVSLRLPYYGVSADLSVCLLFRYNIINCHAL